MRRIVILSYQHVPQQDESYLIETKGEAKTLLNLGHTN
jgi:hypothetical protein